MIHAGLPIWVCSTPVDMRKGFDSLAGHVRSFLGRDPLTDGMFVFRSRSGHLLKILWWDRNGLALYYKRLERGSFRFPVCDGQCMTLQPQQLMQLLEGLQPVVSRVEQPVVISSNPPAASLSNSPAVHAMAVPAAD